MKKYTRMILAFILVALAVMLPVFATNTGGAAASEVAATSGQEVTITVSVFDFPAVDSMAISFQIPDGLELESAAWLCEGYTHDVDLGNNRAVWAHNSSVNMLGSTDVFELVFTVTGCPEANETELLREVEITVIVEQGAAQIRHTATGLVTVSHSGGTATCTEQAVCEHCEQPYGDVLGHNEVEHAGQEATCAEHGWNDYVTCTRCDYTTYVEIPALGHDYRGTVTTEPTCTEKGVMTYRCYNNAAHSYTEDIAPTGHTLVNVPIQYATCTEDGFAEHRECTGCGNWFRPEGSGDSQVDPDHLIIYAQGHDWKAATCTEAKTCKVCGETDGAAKGHTPGAAATCTTAQTCTVCSVELAPAKGHTPGAAATCTTAQTCTVCHIELAAKLAHTPGAAATCTTPQTCTVCHAELAAKLGHKPGAAATCTTAQHCTVCNVELVAKLGHKPGAGATCTTAQTCTVCNVELVAKLGHTPGAAATCTTAQTCTLCNAELAPKLGHTPGAAATCTTAQTCTVCHAELAAKLGHTPGAAATCTTAQTCTVCNAIVTPEKGHKDENKNYACDVCDAELCAHHEGKDIPGQEATCTEAGWTAGKQCAVCGDILKARESIPAKGHTPGAAATCTTAQTCTVCNAELAAKLGHKPGAAATCTTAQTCTVCNVELAAKLGHKPGAAATCTTAQTCTVCNVELVAAKGHSHTAVVTAPTCTEKGYTTHTCACGDSYVDTYVDATGHSLGEWYISKPSTGNEKGEQRRDCANCDHYETQERPLLGDVNGDGRVNTSDAKLIMLYELKLIDETGLDITVADVNGDGRINTGDAKEIMRFELKIISEFSGVKKD